MTETSSVLRVSCRPPGPVSEPPADAPPFDPLRWHTRQLRQTVNCYAYAVNDPALHSVAPYWHKPAPGEASTPSSDIHDVPGFKGDVSTKNVARAAERDGLIPAPHVPGKLPPQKKGFSLVAFAVRPGGYPDFHWYRQDKNGLWSHKPDDLVTNRDNAHQKITNPETADRGAYPEFGGYFYVPRGGIRVGVKGWLYRQLQKRRIEARKKNLRQSTKRTSAAAELNLPVSLATRLKKQGR